VCASQAKEFPRFPFSHSHRRVNVPNSGPPPPRRRALLPCPPHRLPVSWPAVSGGPMWSASLPRVPSLRGQLCSSDGGSVVFPPIKGAVPSPKSISPPSDLSENSAVSPPIFLCPMCADHVSPNCEEVPRLIYFSGRLSPSPVLSPVVMPMVALPHISLLRLCPSSSRR